MGEIFIHETPRPTMATTGERLTAGHGLETELEHFHRYYLARHLARDRSVLDIASGEGYGAATLAQVAKTVVGIDISAEAVAHATHSYPAPNLTFIHGDARRIALPDASIDMVTSFETIEHFLDHGAFLSEVRRVLRRGGLFIVSTPDRDVYSPPNSGANPHHIHELSRMAFRDLCAAHFANVALFTQTTIVGSVLAADDPAAPGANRIVFERRGATHVEACEGPMRGKFCVCIASDGALPALADSLLIHDTTIGVRFADAGALAPKLAELDTALTDARETLARREGFIREGVNVFATLHDRALERADRERGRLTADVSRLSMEVARRDNTIARLHGEVAQRDVAFARAQAELTHRDAHATQLVAEIAKRDAAIARLQNEQAAAFQAAESARMRPKTRLVSHVRRVVTRPIQPFLDTRALRQISGSPLFNADWYLERYPDVAASGANPAEHFLAKGSGEERDPGPDFSTSAYLKSYADVRAARVNPLLHYERVGRAEGRRIQPAELPVVMADDVPAEAEDGRSPPGSTRAATKMVYLSGEPHTPGHTYRVTRMAAAARLAGAEVSELSISEIRPDSAALNDCDLLAIWRAPWTPALEAVIAPAKKRGTRVLYDVDDLMFEPELAREEIIDGIRSQGFDAPSTAALFGRIAQMIGAADITSAPTRYLAGRLQRHGKPAFLLPNGFDTRTWAASRRAVRQRRAAVSDGLVRIGYAAGSRTHQKDLAVAADAIAFVMRERPQTRLVLFRKHDQTCIDVDEFPGLAALHDRVEWRDMVDLGDLPSELARFDISIAPLQLPNPFCEAKSELKYFESGLVEVPLIASPTALFRAAVIHGETGLLAANEQEWRAALIDLVDHAELRARLGAAAYRAILWEYGPERRIDRMRSLLAQVAGAPADMARAFELEFRRGAIYDPIRPSPVVVPPHRAEILQDRLTDADVSIVIPLYNYIETILEALESAAAQSLETLDLIVVDDCSTDGGAEAARTWMLAHRHRFGRLVLARNAANSGLGPTRNVGFALAETRYVIQLDADNRLLPDFARQCLATAEATGAAFVYSQIQCFGDSDEIVGIEPYSPMRLASGNTIDAMALVRVAAWAAVGGADNVRFGWEDYDLWCRFAEHGMFGAQIPDVLAEYRVHRRSMLRTSTDVAENKRRLIADMRRRHSWVLDGVSND
jgi:SAM-dependent methyltransferase/glycosyltransferase involved in cell wall biosynthesis/GT2 family glycosyltransferase